MSCVKLRETLVATSKEIVEVFTKQQEFTQQTLTNFEREFEKLASEEKEFDTGESFVSKLNDFLGKLTNSTDLLNFDVLAFENFPSPKHRREVKEAVKTFNAYIKNTQSALKRSVTRLQGEGGLLNELKNTQNLLLTTAGGGDLPTLRLMETVQRDLLNKITRETTYQQKILVEAGAQHAKFKVDILHLFKVDLASNLYFCYQDVLRQIEKNKQVWETVLKQTGDYLFELLNGIEKDIARLCDVDEVSSVVAPQLYAELEQFLLSIAQFLTQLFGPPETFIEFCAASKPKQVKALSPWQQFGGKVMAEPNMRCVLSAGSVGSGKTLYGLNALKTIMFTKGAENPRKALIYVPNTLFDQWVGGLRNFNNSFLIPDESERKRLTSRETLYGGRTFKMTYRIEDFNFVVILQALAYTMSKQAVRALGVPERIAGGFRDADLSQAKSLLVLVDEFHMTAFVDSQSKFLYSLEGYRQAETTKARYHRTYENIVHFANHMQQTFPTNPNKFVALTATPLTYEEARFKATVSDSLRVLLPFQIAMGRRAPVSNLAQVAEQVMTELKGQTPQTLMGFLQSQGEGFISYVSFTECPWMPSYGTDCKDRVCMFTYPTLTKLPFPVMDGTETRPLLTDFTPIVASLGDKPRAEAGKRARKKVGKAQKSDAGKTEFNLTLKSEMIRDFLREFHPDAAALIYAPCDKTRNRQAYCLWGVGSVLAQPNTVIFWPSELIKDTRMKKNIQARNLKNGFNMKEFYKSLKTAAPRNGPLKVTEEHVKALEKALDGKAAMLLIGKIPSSATTAEKIEVNLVQKIMLQLFVKQKTPLIKYVITQVATGLDAAGSNILFSTVPVQAGTFANQLAGRIARVSAGDSDLHGKLRAYQTLVGEEELKMGQAYFKQRTETNLIFDYILPSVAIDKQWFGPPAVRGGGKKSSATLMTAVVSQVWRELNAASKYRGKTYGKFNARLTHLLETNASLEDVSNVILELLHLPENRQFIPVYLKALTNQDQEVARFIKRFPAAETPVPDREKLVLVSAISNLSKDLSRLKRDLKTIQIKQLTSKEKARDFLRALEGLNVDQIFLFFLYVKATQPENWKYIEQAIEDQKIPSQLQATATTTVDKYLASLRLDQVLRFAKQIQTVWGDAIQALLADVVDTCS